jgi:hypothetical protein
MRWLSRFGWMAFGAALWTAIVVSLYLLPFILGG